MIWNSIRGRNDQIEMFRRSISRGRLSQAYLFAGPEGTGKRLFARRLAQCLFCERRSPEEFDACGQCPACRQMEAGTHPDFHFVCRPEGKSELPISLFVGADDRRGREGLCYDITLRPMSASRKIAVIDDVDDLNDASANALLKTLEEPPARVILILVAVNVEGILPTIRSRCQIVRFGPLAASDIADLLLQEGTLSDRSEAEIVANLSEGSLAVAAQLVDPGLRELRNVLYRELARGCPGGLSLAKTIQEKIEEAADDAPAQRQYAGWLIRFIVEFYTAALRELCAPGRTALPEVRAFAGRPQPAGSDVYDLLMDLIDRATEAAGHVDQRVSLVTLLESLFDDLSRLQRSHAVEAT